MMHFLPSLSFFSTLVLSLSLLHVVRAGSHVARAIGGGSLMRRHVPTNFTQRDRHLEKRFSDARFTFFDAGLGACGKQNSPSDYVVALNAPQYDGGSHCFETITITYNGKTAQAQIVDECVDCPSGALDFSTGLFTNFASLGAGTIYGEWEFGSGATQQEATSSPKPSPSPSPSPKPSPSPTPSSSSSAPSSSSSSVSSASPSSASVSSSASPSSSASSSAPSSAPSATPTQSGTLFDIAQAFIGIAVIAVEAPHAQ